MDLRSSLVLLCAFLCRLFQPFYASLRCPSSLCFCCPLQTHSPLQGSPSPKTAYVRILRQHMSSFKGPTGLHFFPFFFYNLLGPINPFFCLVSLCHVGLMVFNFVSDFISIKLLRMQCFSCRFEIPVKRFKFMF